MKVGLSGTGNGAGRRKEWAIEAYQFDGYQGGRLIPETWDQIRWL